jgi:biopolymer transport protein ExbD
MRSIRRTRSVFRSNSWRTRPWLSRVVVLRKAQVSQKNILHLIVQPNGIVDVKRGESQQVQQMRPREIEGLWRQEVSANPNMIAAVKTHQDAPYRYMMDVLDALHSANAERISLQLLEN